MQLAHLGLALTAPRGAGGGGDPPPPEPVAPPGVYNLTRASMANYITAIQALKAGTADAKLLAIGDSNTVGLSAIGSTPGWNNPRTLGYVNQLAGLMTSVPTSGTGFLGSGNCQNRTNLVQMDSRLTFPSGTGWAANTNVTTKTTGGLWIFATSGVNSEMVFTTPDTATHLDLYYISSTVAGSFGNLGITVDGGTEIVFDTRTGGSAVTSMQMTTIALGASGTHVVRFRNLTTPVFLTGMLFRDTSVKRQRIVNAGAFGWTTDDWVDTASGSFAPGLTYYTFGAHAATIHLTINDSNIRADPTLSMANEQTMITNLKAVGTDPILICPQPINGTATQGVQNAYNAAIRALGAANNCPVIDLMYDYQTYAAWSAASLATDGLHPNFAGHTYVANRIKAALDAVVAVA